MANDELNGRAVINFYQGVLPQSGPDRKSAIDAEARVLTNALAGIPDKVNLFDHEGQIVFLAPDGRLCVVGEGLLTTIIRENVVTIGLRPGKEPGVYEKSYIGFEPNIMAVRTLLREEPSKGGLIGRLPLALVESPRQPPAAETPPEIPATIDPAEIEAGKRAAARWAGLGSPERLQQEIEAGQRAAARAAARQNPTA